MLEKDQRYIWHPYTQHKTVKELLPIARAKGLYLFDEHGNKYMDVISSWWTNIHGHSHPFIAESIYQQALTLEHVIFAGCTHQPAVSLAEQLMPLLPGNMQKLFYSDNGSTAIEVGLKMAIQYWKNKGELKRNKILALHQSYHGDTFGAMSVSERGVFTWAFENHLFDVIFLDTPKENETWNVAGIPWDEVACCIYEPLVQGAGGMKMYDALHLDDLIASCKKNEILCIADEVMTGFGRTGKLFASDHVPSKPDIICLSKGLTGGSLPLAITACSEKIYNAFFSQDLHLTFFHGHSFTANPLGCAAALASLALLQKEECLQSIQDITAGNRKFVEVLKEKKNIINPRSTGTILAFELHSNDNMYLSKVREETMKLALSNGIFLRPLGNTVYIMPPYCITAEECNTVYSFLEKIAVKDL